MFNPKKTLNNKVKSSIKQGIASYSSQVKLTEIRKEFSRQIRIGAICQLSALEEGLNQR